MNHIALIGDIYKDKIIHIHDSIKQDTDNCIVRKYDRLGGIFNFIRAISKKNVDTYINCTINSHDMSLIANEISQYDNVFMYNTISCPSITTPSATLIIDKFGNKTTFALPNKKDNSMTNFDIVPDSKWCHIMYANQLHFLDEAAIAKIRRNVKVSVDLCSIIFDNSVFERLQLILPYVDCLFASEQEILYLASFVHDDIKCDTKDVPVAMEIVYNKMTKCSQMVQTPPEYAPCIIVHAAKSSHLYKDNCYVKHDNGIHINGINPVGAGDFFAAHCIYYLAIEKLNIDSALLSRAHIDTAYMLKDN